MNAPEERDEWLMTQVARGKRDQLEPLIRRHATPLLTFIHRMVGDRHHSEELFQEVFLAVWVKRGTYKFPRPFKPWLYAIALNKCRAAFRRKMTPTVPFTEEENVPSSVTASSSPTEVAIATETAALVSAAVTHLPPQQRTVVVLRIWEGLSYAQIAEIVGREEVTVRTNMHHGLAAMRRYLEPRLKV